MHIKSDYIISVEMINNLRFFGIDFQIDIENNSFLSLRLLFSFGVSLFNDCFYFVFYPFVDALIFFNAKTFIEICF